MEGSLEEPRNICAVNPNPKLLARPQALGGRSGDPAAMG